MATKREDPTTNPDPGNDNSDEDIPDRRRPDEGENDRDVEVRAKDGKVEVDVHQESRKERREKERREERQRELEAATAPLRQQLEETRRLIQDLASRPVAAPVQQRQQQSDDQDEYMRLSEEMETVIGDIRARTQAGGLSPDDAKKLKQKYYKLERQRAEIVADSKLKTYQPPQGPSAHEQMLASAHSEVWFNPRAKAHAASLAQAEQNRREFKQGRPLQPAEIIEIQHAALKQAGEELGLTKPNLPTPSPGERSRFSGTGVTSRGAGGKVTRQLQDHEVEAARAMFPDDDDNVAIEKFIRVADKNNYFGQG